MKLKFLLASFMFIASNLLVAKGDDKGYDLKFKVKGLKKDCVCYLANYYGDKQYIQDTAKVNAEGWIEFKKGKKLPGGIYLMVMPKKKYFEFIMDEGQDFKMETMEADSAKGFVKEMRVQNSKENSNFYDYLKFIDAKQEAVMPLQAKLKKVKNKKDSAKPLIDQITKIDNEVKAYKTDFIKKTPTSFVTNLFKAMTEVEIPEAPLLKNGRKDSLFTYRYMVQHYWDNFNFADDRLLRTPILMGKIKNYIDNLTYPHPDSISIALDEIIEKSKANHEMFRFVLYWATNSYETSQIMGMDAVVQHLFEKYYMSKQATWVDSAQLVKITQRALQLKPILIGKYTPNLTMKDSTYHDKTLYDVRADFTILYFWDYGCSHCKVITPKLLDWYNKVKSTKGVEVFAVGTETNATEWKKYIKEHNLSWINVFDPTNETNFRHTYDIYSTPVIYVLDANKKIIAKRLDVEQLDGLIDHFIKMKSKNN